MSTFQELGIIPEIQQAVAELGFEQPMPVQTEVIPQLLANTRDIIALAQTGTGKTAAFGIPIIQKTDIGLLSPQTLILCPTRELCLQIAGDLTDYSAYVEDIKILPVYGGSSIESQIRTLKRGVHIIVATPGRLIDLIKRKTVSLSNVHTMVLDEADEMLNMGFSEDIDEILSYLPQERSMLLFSATMPKEIEKITRKYMQDPIEITIGRKNEGAQNVRHIYFMVHAKDKYLALKRIVDYYPNIYGIIFCRTRKETQEIADKLLQDGYDADSLHGDLSQAQRDFVMAKYRNHNLQLLVATDVAARGLDVDDVTHIINFGLPDDFEIYTHRSGRTGRAGKTGTSISIIHTKEKGKVTQIEKLINKKFEKREIPKGDVICEKQLFNFVDKVEKVKVNEGEIERLLPSIFRKLEWLEKEDIIKRIVSLEFNRLIEYYQLAEEIEQPQEYPSRRGRDESRGKRGERQENGSRKAEKGYTRLFINVGKIDNVNPATLMGFINDNVKGKVPVGRIDLMKNFSFFEVPEELAGKIVNTFRGMYIEDRKLIVQLAQEAERSGNGRAKSEFGGKKRKNKKRY
ncbi:DEAD/DEAH box helicase [Proteiniphilum sp. UBA5510]|jgi:ATP-dependent RNA helicase DeaD|uniref:DEAD/DEAH box helicase n=1 Tax=Proteiniphilum sp. UBA5510 TaxID=1947286 RepID=UPI00257BBBCE|nr:DEAD/DEAH box helicase [Proteiniphilum sp. UBA5510]MDD4631315.1 DEAD/DEAH box helicase [Proteiniphilum sp.]